MNSISPAQNALAFQQTTTAFQSGGRRITVEIYRPKTAGKMPAVLVLHGAGGIFMDGPAIRRFARALAQNGFAAFVVHYFERTGRGFATSAAIHKNFDTWRGTVNDAVDYMAVQPEVNPRTLGCFGYSLGGYLSLAQAAHDGRIKAVVELAGAIDKEHVSRVKRLPPILILHGEQDRHVSVENAYVLEGILKRLRVPYQMKIYAAEGHVLRGASQLDAAMRAVRFLQQHLN